MTIETINLSDTVRVRIEADADAVNPLHKEDLVKVAYLRSSRHLLGNEPLDHDGLDAIKRGIESGALIGLPVFAYIHGGVTLKATTTNPFHCRWDSGQCGFAYVERSKALHEWGGQRLSKRVRESAYSYIRGTVDEFTQYLNGDVFGFVVETLEDGEWVERESGWGYYGQDYCRTEGCHAAEHLLEASHAGV